MHTVIKYHYGNLNIFYYRSYIFCITVMGLIFCILFYLFFLYCGNKFFFFVVIQINVMRIEVYLKNKTLYLNEFLCVMVKLFIKIFLLR